MSNDTRFNMFATLTKTKSVDGSKPIIFGTASNDQTDLSGDAMALSALRQMEKAFGEGLAVFADHSYRVVEDTLGRTVSAKIVKREARHDLDVQIELNTANPRAVQVFQAIESGIKTGLSIGCQVLDADYETRGGKRVLVIKQVKTLELSIVSIPAAQGEGFGSWITNARKAASYAWAAKSGDVRDTGNGDEIAILRFLVAGYKLRALAAETAHADLEKSALELVKLVDALMDLPAARKVADPAAFDEIASKYPYLHAQIANDLAIAANSTRGNRP